MSNRDVELPNMFDARTSVEKIGSGHLGPYRVEVWGAAPNDYVRLYTIKHSSPELASREAIQMFTRDIIELTEKKKNPR